MDDERLAAFRLLGIPSTSHPDAVVRAYRQLARTHHPDMSSDPDAGQRFAALTAAFRVASASSAPPAADTSEARLGRSWPGPPIVAGPVLHAPHPSGGRGGWRRG